MGSGGIEERLKPLCGGDPILIRLVHRQVSESAHHACLHLGVRPVRLRRPDEHFNPARRRNRLLDLVIHR